MIKYHLFQEGEHLLRAPQGQLHPHNSGEHQPQLGKLVAQVDRVKRAKQLGVVDRKKEVGLFVDCILTWNSMVEKQIGASKAQDHCRLSILIVKQV